MYKQLKLINFELAFIQHYKYFDVAIETFKYRILQFYVEFP